MKQLTGSFPSRQILNRPCLTPKFIYAKIYLWYTGITELKETQRFEQFLR
jgi:hypothetical protein